MKPIFTSLLLSLCLCSFSQNTESAADTCLKRKLLPCKETSNQVAQIDTIEFSKLGILVDKLYSKMSSSQELTIEEDKILVLLMNTVNWAELDNQSKVLVSYSKLNSIEDFFEKTYKRTLYCKYNVCSGRGYTVPQSQDSFVSSLR